MYFLAKCFSAIQIEVFYMKEKQIYVFIFNLHVDLYKPVVKVDGKREENVNVTIHERRLLNITCSVDGKPTPTIRVSRNSQEKIMKTSKSVQVLRRNAQCNDTDTYRCTASSKKFRNNVTFTEFALNVLCKLILKIPSYLPLNCSSYERITNLTTHVAQINPKVGRMRTAKYYKGLNELLHVYP
jgi:hypothetical protein